MRALLQRVLSASVTVSGKVVGQIGKGLCVFVGISGKDSAADADFMCAAVPRPSSPPPSAALSTDRLCLCFCCVCVSPVCCDSRNSKRKVLSLRLWDDPISKKAWNSSVTDCKYDVLLVSQFTLYGLLKGNRVDFHEALDPAKARPMWEAFVKDVRATHTAAGGTVAEGQFGAEMAVSLVNDGPVTLWINSDDMEFKKPKPVRGIKQSAASTTAADADAAPEAKGDSTATPIAGAADAKSPATATASPAAKKSVSAKKEGGNAGGGKAKAKALAAGKASVNVAAADAAAKPAAPPAAAVVSTADTTH
jgi:D-aminoacyl-tRNA deacylase